MDAEGSRQRNAGGANGQRVNEMIRIAQVRVISEEGEQLGVMSSQEALAKAREAGLDLVEVSAQSKPPVCRIMDYGKYKYQQKKRAGKQQANKPQQIRELRLRPKTGAADVLIKANKAREFLSKRDKVMISVVFRGRELAHIEEGEKVLALMIQQLEDVAKIEAPLKQMGKRIFCTLAPK